jgi:hypothetical protein
MLCRRLSPLFAASLWVVAAAFPVSLRAQTSSNEPSLTEEQKKDFLLHAKVVRSHQLGKGITNPWRLTLSDGTLTHDAAFQSVDVHKSVEHLPSGDELNFVDSYHYDIAGYELAKLLGLDNMVPVTVERKWQGEPGALSWWVAWKWDEGMRSKQKLEPPDADAWNKQMYKIRVFDELIYDTDPNLTNVLITEDWKIWRIDFSRAFRRLRTLRRPQNLEQCDRQLLEKLRKLDYDEVLARTKPHLNKLEVEALMARRDKIVDYFQKLAAQKGESAVLY